MSLMAGFAAFALALALLGIYGVISHAVSNAKKEIGIRMALGAKRSDVVRLVFRYSAALLSTGLVVGILGALAAGRILASELFEIPAADPTTLISVAAVLLITGFGACLIPALSAMRVDPAITLRYE